MENFEIHKFGGTTTGSLQGLKRIAEIVEQSQNIPVLVVSAIAGMTDLLTEIVENISEELIPHYVEAIIAKHNELSPRNLKLNKQFLKKVDQLRRVLYGICYTQELSGTLRDLVLSFGEQLVVFVIADVLEEHVTERSIHIIYPEDMLVTNGDVGRALIDLEKSAPRLQEKIKHILHSHTNPVIVIPGFYGVSEEGKITLFGRSGTDYSASAIANLLDSSFLTIWKDVSGFMSVDPRIVPEAIRIPELSYEEASELSHFGAKILHHRAVLPAREKGIPILIRNIQNPEKMTIIQKQATIRAGQIIKSITLMKGMAILKFYNTSGGSEKGIFFQLAKSVASCGIEIISIATSQTCISFLVRKAELEPNLKTIETQIKNIVDDIQIKSDVALIACVGEQLASTPGIAYKVFGAVSSRDVNVEMISAGASSTALHFTVNEDDVEQAVNAIHSAFMKTNEPFLKIHGK